MRSPNMVVAVVSLVTLAACGSGGSGAGSGPTRAAFIEQSDAVCATFGDVVGAPLGRIFEGSKVLGMDDAATAFPEVEAAIRTLLAERGALEAPAADRVAIADVNRTERAAFETLITDAKAAIDERDAGALGAAFDRADQSFQRIDEVQQAYGFQTCGAYEYPAEPGLTLVPATAPAGTRVTVRSLTPCEPVPPGATGTQVRVELWSTSTRLGTRGGRILVDATGPIAADGSWSVDIDVPATTTSGRHAVSARCEALVVECSPGCPYGSDRPDAKLVVGPAS